MFSKLKIPVLIGLTFYGIAFITVTFLGYNSTSFTVIAYLYIILAVILGLKYEVMHGDTPSLLRNLVLVVEDEETRLKRVFTGEKFKIKGEVERVQ